MSIRGRRGLGVASDAEISQAPMPFEAKNVLRLEVTMHDPALKVNEGIADVLQDGDSVLKLQHGAGCLKVLAQGCVGPRHDKYPVVLVLATVDDRHHVPDTAKINEEQLATGARLLGYELGHERRLTTQKLVDLTEPAAADMVANDPRLGEMEFLAGVAHKRSLGEVVVHRYEPALVTIALRTTLLAAGLSVVLAEFSKHRHILRRRRPIATAINRHISAPIDLSVPLRVDQLQRRAFPPATRLPIPFRVDESHHSVVC
jgi:hypothetical protein